MHLTRDKTVVITNTMRSILKRHIDLDRPIQAQKKDRVKAYLAECSKLPDLRRYAGAWPAEMYCRLYLRGKLYKKKGSSHIQRPFPNLTEGLTADINSCNPGTVAPPVSGLQNKPSGEDASSIHGQHGRELGGSRPSSLKDFCAEFGSQQDSVSKVLQATGVHTLADLEMVAKDQEIQDDYFYPLVMTKKLTHLQLCLMRSALRRAFTSIPNVI